MKKKQAKWTLEDLPSANSYERKMMLSISKLPEYNADIKQGLLFFSEEELEELENKYKETGMTRKDVVSEAHKKWLLKESTLKSYIHKDQLPGALKRLKTDKAMISIYPPDMIRHLNFVRYCLFSGSKAIDLLMTIMKDMSVTYQTHLEATSVEIDPSGGDGNDCIHSLYIGIARLDTGIAWAEDSVEKAFLQHPSKRKQYLGYVNDLNKLKEQIASTLEDFVKKLKGSTTPVDFKKIFSDPTNATEDSER